MGYSLKNLKAKGIFKGEHLLDRWHVMRKYRRALSTRNFKTLREAIIATDKLEYQARIREMMKNATCEEEVKGIRHLDRNCHLFCYSQIKPVFVGEGISTSYN